LSYKLKRTVSKPLSDSRIVFKEKGKEMGVRLEN
jgi:hypothetical protein